MTQFHAHDVIVIGGGPAGSTAAALLARYGHDVVLFEKEKFPREHVGESLLPFCYTLFQELGLEEELQRYFVRKPGVRFIDRSGHTSTTWCFNHVIKDDSHRSFQVMRGEFDHILLKNAAKFGAQIRQEVKVTDVDTESARDRVRVQTRDAHGRSEIHQARFIVDASGRDALIGAANGWRKPREELDRTALWSHWGNVKLKGGLEEGLSIIVYLGEEKKGWLWIFPLGPDRITAGFVAQNAYFREQCRKLQEAGSQDWRFDLCVKELSSSSLVRELLGDEARSKMLLPIMVNGNYSYEVSNHYGTNYAMVGDARGFIDPIFSSGVFLSMKSAFLVAAAVDVELRRSGLGPSEALVDAYKKITGAYDFVHRMIQLFYDPHAITWAEAGADGQVHKRHESALAAGHYMLSGDFFENHEKYRRFFDVLADPRGFERYKKTVIDRPSFNQTTCHASFEEVFASMLEQDAIRKQAHNHVAC